MSWVVVAIVGIVLGVISMGISIYQMMTAKTPEPPVPPAQNISYIPTAEQGKAVPIVFGTRVITTPNVVWWGNPRALPNRVNVQ
jgi:hypothetical protein